ncbi:MAG: PadR family transcriptional regulator [Myxococcales bacterium]|nr:PadR family transcriptional regulator [Myxococcales bacterium]
MSIDYTILGVLIESPAHGYSIKKYLLENFSRHFGVNDGQLYPSLGRLEARGWIRKRVVHQRRSPAKHLYRVTPAGNAAFFEWLSGSGDSGEAEPVRYDFYWRHAFLQRCGFFRHLGPEQVAQQGAVELGRVSQQIADLEGVQERMDQDAADPYRRMIVEYGVRYQKMRRDWLAELLEISAGSAARSPRVAGRSS